MAIYHTIRSLYFVGSMSQILLHYSWKPLLVWWCDKHHISSLLVVCCHALLVGSCFYCADLLLLLGISSPILEDPGWAFDCVEVQMSDGSLPEIGVLQYTEITSW